jgi:hypothetical protein
MIWTIVTASVLCGLNGAIAYVAYQSWQSALKTAIQQHETGQMPFGIQEDDSPQTIVLKLNRGTVTSERTFTVSIIGILLFLFVMGGAYVQAGTLPLPTTTLLFYAAGMGASIVLVWILRRFAMTPFNGIRNSKGKKV